MVKHYNLTIKTPKFFIGEEEPLKIENLNIQELIDTTKNKLDELYDIKDFKLNPQIIYNMIHKDTRPANPVLKLLTNIEFH
tara:strand:+ start:50 stop:292 length:243 start_codon:yes stop_codon:yes gene_type:complete